jgi:2-dehydropantoate 2-reductase
MAETGRVLIVGAGAIGGCLGALLARAGAQVVFLTRSEAAARGINRDGLALRGVRGSFTARPRAVSRPGDLSDPFRAVFAAVKTYDLPSALRPVLPVTGNCPVVSLQNGICLEELEALAGRHRAVACVVGWGATMHGEAEMELTSEGEMVIGCRGGGESETDRPDLEAVRNLLSLAFPVSISRDIIADLYSKLIINSCITTLGAISGRTLGWMLGRRLYRRIFIGIMKEAMAAAHAAGIAVPPYAGRLDYDRFLGGTGPLGELRRHLFIRLMGVKYRRLKSSSLQSLERGRLTEVDAFNGYIVRTARALGLSAPLNELLTDMVHGIEAGRRPIGPENFSPEIFGGLLTD